VLKLSTKVADTAKRKSRDGKLFFSGGKTGRKVVKKRVRNLFEHKENDKKQTVLKIRARISGGKTLFSQKLHKTFLRQEKYGKNETIHINSFKNEQFFIPKEQIRTFLRKMHLILYSIWFNM
jgi:hypothetical protein